jgi:ribonuclease HI
VILEEIIINEDHIQALQVGLAELVLTAGWYNWWERRQFTNEESVQKSSRSAMAIVALTKNYMLAEKKTGRLRQGWKKPPSGKVMVNVDAGFDENGGCGSVGAVIRDSSGGFLAATHSFVRHLVDAPMAEAYALKEGLMLAQRIGCNKLIIQSDCMEVVQIMQGGGFSANSAAPIYDECNNLWSGFQEITIEHCNREDNLVAHTLAQRARSLRQNCIWDDDPPSCIIDGLANDVSILNE